MTTLSVSVDIDAPPARTWEVVTDWERQGRWMPMTTVQRAGELRNGLGTSLTARSGVGSLSFLDRMVVDVWQPPYRCEVRHLGKVVTGRGVFLVDELPGGRSRFTWREELDGTGPRRLVDLLTLGPTRALLTVALRRLARLVEAEAEAA